MSITNSFPPSYIRSRYSNNSETTISPEPTPGHDYPTGTTTGSLLLVVGCVGFVGNLVVIIVILNYRATRKKLTNRFIINQSFIDLAASICLIGDTSYRISLSADPVLSPDSMDDQLLCRIWITGLPLWSMFMSSAYGILLLSFERYLAIVHPLRHVTGFTARRVAVAMAATWCIGIAYNLSYLIPTAEVETDRSCHVLGIWPNERTRISVGLFTFFIQFLLPVAGMLTFYGLMTHTLRHRLRHHTNSESVGEGSNFRFSCTNWLNKLKLCPTQCYSLVSGYCRVICRTMCCCLQQKGVSSSHRCDVRDIELHGLNGIESASALPIGTISEESINRLYRSVMSDQYHVTTTTNMLQPPTVTGKYICNDCFSSFKVINDKKRDVSFRQVISSSNGNTSFIPDDNLFGEVVETIAEEHNNSRMVILTTGRFLENGSCNCGLDERAVVFNTMIEPFENASASTNTVQTIIDEKQSRPTAADSYCCDNVENFHKFRESKSLKETRFVEEFRCRQIIKSALPLTATDDDDQRQISACSILASVAAIGCTVSQPIPDRSFTDESYWRDKYSASMREIQTLQCKTEEGQQDDKNISTSSNRQTLNEHSLVVDSNGTKTIAHETSSEADKEITRSNTSQRTACGCSTGSETASTTAATTASAVTNRSKEAVTSTAQNSISSARRIPPRGGTTSPDVKRLPVHGANIRSVPPSTPFDRARSNVVKTLFTVGASFIACWLLNEILFVAGRFGVYIGNTLYNVSVCLVCLSCCINPFIYALQYKDFQSGSINLARRLMERLCPSKATCCD